MIGAGTQLNLLHRRFKEIGASLVNWKNFRIFAGNISALVRNIVSSNRPR
jgi:hypothetical protein